MATTVHKLVHVVTKNSKLYDEVTATIIGSYFLHADEHTIVLINKIKELSLYIQKSKVIIKGKL